jgi:flagellar motor component MotA
MVLFFGFVGVLSGMPAFYVDFPSAIIILVPMIFFLVISKSGTVMGNYFRSSFKKNYGYTKTELESISAAAKNTIKFILGMGGLGFIAGLVGSLANIGAPERLGPNLAVSLITLVYSIAFGFFVFFPVEAWAVNKINLSEKNEQ